MVTVLKNKCSVSKRIRFPTFWYNCYYFTCSDTYFIQFETLLINHPSYGLLSVSPNIWPILINDTVTYPRRRESPTSPPPEPQVSHAFLCSVTQWLQLFFSTSDLVLLFPVRPNVNPRLQNLQSFLHKLFCIPQKWDIYRVLKHAVG